MNADGTVASDTQNNVTPSLAPSFKEEPSPAAAQAPLTPAAAPSYTASSVSTDIDSGNGTNVDIIYVKKDYTIVYILVVVAIIVFLSNK